MLNGARKSKELLNFIKSIKNRSGKAVKLVKDCPHYSAGCAFSVSDEECLKWKCLL